MKQPIEETLALCVHSSIQFYEENLWEDPSPQNRSICGTALAIADRLARKMEHWDFASAILRITSNESLPTDCPVGNLPRVFQEAVDYLESK